MKIACYILAFFSFCASFPAFAETFEACGAGANARDQVEAIHTGAKSNYLAHFNRVASGDVALDIDPAAMNGMPPQMLAYAMIQQLSSDEDNWGSSGDDMNLLSEATTVALVAGLTGYEGREIGQIAAIAAPLADCDSLDDDSKQQIAQLLEIADYSEDVPLSTLVQRADSEMLIERYKSRGMTYAETEAMIVGEYEKSAGFAVAEVLQGDRDLMSFLGCSRMSSLPDVLSQDEMQTYVNFVFSRSAGFEVFDLNDPAVREILGRYVGIDPSRLGIFRRDACESAPAVEFQAFFGGLTGNMSDSSASEGRNLLTIGGMDEWRGTTKIANSRFADQIVHAIQADQPQTVSMARRLSRWASADRADTGEQIQPILEFQDRMAAFRSVRERQVGSMKDLLNVNEADQARYAPPTELQTQAATEAYRSLRLNNSELVGVVSPEISSRAVVQQEMLRSGEAILSLNTNGIVTTVTLITPNDVHGANARARPDEISNLITSLRDSLIRFGETNGVAAFDAASARTLYEHLLLPLEEVLLGMQSEPITRLYVLENDLTAPVPLDVLITANAASIKDTLFLIDHFEIVSIPSISSLAERPDTPSALRTVAMVSNPNDGAEVQEASIQQVAISLGAPLRTKGTPNACNLPSIPATQTIADILANQFEALDALAGPDASETKVRELSESGAFERADIIAFNTHGLLASENPMLGEPALALMPEHGSCENGALLPSSSDGLLTASEVYSLNVPASLVMLSACNTDAPFNEGAEPLSGLTRAFFAAGARNVLVSNWKALVSADPDQLGETETFVNEFAQSIASAPEQSLAYHVRSAKLATKSSAPNPGAWAVFSLVGTGD